MQAEAEAAEVDLGDDRFYFYDEQVLSIARRWRVEITDLNT
jgi:hypothetical protein